MKYEIGKFYNFWVIGICGHRILLEDDEKTSFSVQGYDFQVEWDWASPQVPVSVLSCYVKFIAQDGTVILEQNRKNMLLVLYPEVERNETVVATFSIERLVTINRTLYYVVKDVYGLSHMFKPYAELRDKQPGDELELNVVGILDQEGNKSRLVFEETGSVRNQEPSDDTNIDDTPVGEFGEETDKVEFKSTIVYPAGAMGPDIDTQITVIMQSIAGFMNANGGVLHIGVNDNGYAVGIEREYYMINSSQKDKREYQTNKDGYENKIRSSVNFYLGQVAQDYLSVKFSCHNNHTVCSIEIEPSQRVTWFNGHDAYKRMGNRTSHLRSDAIEKLVLDKLDFQRPRNTYVAPTPVSTEDEALQTNDVEVVQTTSIPTIAKVAQPIRLKMIGEVCQGTGSFYMNMFSNGEWSWSKKIPKDSDLEFCIPINKPASKNDLIMVYADGCVNRVDAYHLHLDKKENKRYQNGRRNDGVQLVKVFHAMENDLLGCFCKQNGHEFVKVHAVSHVSRHDSMGLKGNRVINTIGISDVTDSEIWFVSSEHSQRLSALMKTENQLSTSLGVQMDLKKNSKFLQVRDTLKVLCDIPSEQAVG